MRSAPGNSFFPKAHSFLLTKKEWARNQDKSWGWTEEREVFGESHVNQGGPRRGEPNDRGNLLPGGQVYRLI